jgi:adenylate cyclase
MSRNVEVKARLRDREGVEALVRERASHGPELIVQEDFFYGCSSGRLKLRIFDEARGELIFYRRPDTEGPKESVFCKAPTSDPEAMTEVLEFALGVVGEVRKRRTFYRVGQTRVHLDEVDGLGHYLELEVVLRPDQTTADGVAIAEELVVHLGLDGADLEARAYVDLLKERQRGRTLAGG